MNKRQLLASVAKAMTSNWIASGDRKESQRDQTERTIRRMYADVHMDTLRIMLEQMTKVEVT